MAMDVPIMVIFFYSVASIHRCCQKFLLPKVLKVLQWLKTSKFHDSTRIFVYRVSCIVYRVPLVFYRESVCRCVAGNVNRVAVEQ